MLRVAPYLQRSVCSEDNIMIGPFPKKALQNIFSYLPSALEQRPLRLVDKQWCALTTESIKANTMPVADVRAYLVFFKSGLDVARHPPQIEQIKALDQTLEQRREAQPLFGLKWHFAVIEELLQIHFSAGTIHFKIPPPDSEFAKLYSQRCNAYGLTRHFELKLLNSMEFTPTVELTLADYQNITTCIQTLTKIKYILPALMVTQMLDEMLDDANPDLLFGEQREEYESALHSMKQKIVDLLIFNGDLKRAHSFLNETRSEKLRKMSFKKFYKTLIAHHLEEPAIQITQTKNLRFYQPPNMSSYFRNDTFWITYQVNPLKKALIESGRDPHEFASV